MKPDFSDSQTVNQNLLKLFRLFRRNIWILILSTILGLLISGVYGFYLIPKQYRAAVITNTIAKYFSASAVDKMGAADVQIIDSAVIPDKPISRGIVMILAIGAFVGLLLGGGVVLLMTSLDTTVHRLYICEWPINQKHPWMDAAFHGKPQHDEGCPSPETTSCIDRRAPHQASRWAVSR